MHLRYLLLFLLCITATSYADSYPELDVYFLCSESAAIIVGEELQDDKVKVTKWIKGAPTGNPESIVVTDISKHSKELEAYWTNFFNTRALQLKQPTTPAKKLTTRRFVAFLERKDDVWTSWATIENSGLCGSCGLIWIEDGRCYHYRQADNPGPYDLFEGKEIKTESELMRAIDIGLRDTKEWNKSLNTENLAQRAEKIVRFTLPGTSPEAPRTTHLYHTREPLRALGKTAVPALRSQIGKWRQGDNLDEVVLILYDLGQDARESLPDLITLLNQPERAHSYYVLSAIRTVGNSSCIDAIRPFLQHSNDQVRMEAIEAISELEKRQPR